MYKRQVLPPVCPLNHLVPLLLLPEAVKPATCSLALSLSLSLESETGLVPGSSAAPSPTLAVTQFSLSTLPWAPRVPHHQPTQPSAGTTGRPSCSHFRLHNNGHEHPESILVAPATQSSQPWGVCFPLPPADKVPECGSFILLNESPVPRRCAQASVALTLLFHSQLPFHCWTPGSFSNACFCVAANCFQFQQSRSPALHKVQTLWP